MSFNKLNSAFDEIQDAINDCQSDVTKFIEGNREGELRLGISYKL